jgi:hypothetical protein
MPAHPAAKLDYFAVLAMTVWFFAPSLRGAKRRGNPCRRIRRQSWIASLRSQ